MLGPHVYNGVNGFRSLLARQWRYQLRRRQQQPLHTASASERIPILQQQRSITVVGGGLAGLSVVYHLLDQTTQPLSITVRDKCSQPGLGGASAVAGGYVLLGL